MRIFSILGLFCIVGLVIAMSGMVSALYYPPHHSSNAEVECEAWGHYHCVCPTPAMSEGEKECIAFGNIGKGH